jgi:hypothetical protein
MAEKLIGHPILIYVTYVLPMLLLAIELAVNANLFLVILTIAWLGVAFVILFLPIESDNGSSSS